VRARTSNVCPLRRPRVDRMSTLYRPSAWYLARVSKYRRRPLNAPRSPVQDQLADGGNRDHTANIARGTCPETVCVTPPVHASGTDLGRVGGGVNAGGSEVSLLK
jgi:hypothetical protein